jgi:hypothetical protein
MESKKIIKKLIDLYVVNGDKYLIQNQGGIYSTVEKGKLYKNGNKMYGLQDWQYENHLNGKKTIGVFSKAFSKFITFDVDFHDPEFSKWITQKVMLTLDDLNIKYYVNYSGGKGYHIDLFFEDLIHVEHAKKFYNYVLDLSDVRQYFKNIPKKIFTMEYEGRMIQLGDVEFRPTDDQGVKIPLGIHQKTDKYCGFCNLDDGLSVMSKEDSQEYLFTIKKMYRQTILDIIGVEDKIFHDKNTLTKTEKAISKHTPLENYVPNENYSIDLAIRMLQDGLQVQGSRNNSIFLIGLYFKYMGMDESKCRDELYTWMNWQDLNTYTTPLTECYKEIDSTVKNMYLKNYNLAAKVRDLTVTYDEIKWIIDSCPEKNQKLIAYSMLIHSKRHANLQGVFFMTIKNLESVTGLDDNTVERQVNKLINLGVIEVVARNQKQKGTVKKKANLYRINILETSDSPNLENEIYVTDKSNDIIDCMKFYYTNTELKLILPRKQYENVMAG